jgi:hypothetical protein
VSDGRAEIRDDFAAAGHVARHSAQRPDGDVEHTAWRYSLMNWCNDPLA